MRRCDATPNSVVENVRTVLATTKARVVACGLANPGETALIWRKSDGQPLSQAISRQDRRTAAFCSRLARATALGVAFLAGLGDLWTNQAELVDLWRTSATCTPRPASGYAALYPRWREAVERARGWISVEGEVLAKKETSKE